LSQNANFLTDRFVLVVSTVLFVAKFARLDWSLFERCVPRTVAGVAFDRPIEECVVWQDEPSGRGDNDFDIRLVILENVVDRERRREDRSIGGNFDTAHFAVWCLSHDIGEGSTSVERDNPA
jgi:hypothetical protein